MKKKWLYRFLWAVDIRWLSSRCSEALREIGVLWLVFAMLDKLVAGRLTGTWIATHCTLALASWTLGLYIESIGDRSHA